MMEDGDEEDNDDNYRSMFPEYDDTAMEDNEEEGGEERAPDEPGDDDLRRAISDVRRDCGTDKESLQFDKMLEDHQKLLYPGCEDGQKKLGSLLELLQWKAEAGGDSGFEKLLIILKKALQERTNCPPVALRGLLPENVRLAIVKICAFLNAISQKVMDPESLSGLQVDVVECLVSFELLFPPSFFNIMTHLLVHLVNEIRILGPVFLHNMFPFERFMGFLKKYVHNRARPKGSISKGYGTEEVIEFCVDFLPDLNPIGVPKSRYEGRLTGKGTLGRKATVCRDKLSFNQVHYTVLYNSSLVAPYIEKHKNVVREVNRASPSP
ncbi:hypothetical protein QYE76_000397 [Lolium multiflorum]|uniref:DUF4218 domain-containing protein n=1 Tax=Lolium multiflorum TaxID=4521 RepID=A0AAD8RL22_LOLMU|nr:hypothetical protein QYE76_000397 [Lolium multiflorum]